MAELRDATSDVVYRPLAGLAVAGFAISCLFAGVVLLSTLIAIHQGAPFFFSEWTMAIPAAGIVVSLLALNQIRNSEGTRAGQKLATYGLWISLITGAGYFAYSYFTGLALGQQANRFFLDYEQDSGFFPRLIKGGKDKIELNHAFLLTLPPNERAGVRPEQEVELVRQFDKPGNDGSLGMLSRFRNEIFVMGLAKGGEAASVEPLGMQSWKYDKRSYQVNCLFRLKMPEAVAIMALAARSSEGEIEGQSRQWFVDMTTARPQSIERTPLGNGLNRLRREAVAYLQALEDKLRTGKDLPDFATLDVTDWNQLDAAAHPERKKYIADIFQGRNADSFWHINVTFNENALTSWDRDEQGRVSLAIPFSLVHTTVQGPLTGTAEGLITVRTTTAVDPEASAAAAPIPPQWEIQHVNFLRYRQRVKK